MYSSIYKLYTFMASTLKLLSEYEFEQRNMIYQFLTRWPYTDMYDTVP